MSDAVENLKKKALEKAYKKDSKGHPKIEEEAALLRGMAEMFEEFKPFPKDKVNRSIEKKEKSGDADDALKAHTQKAVKNYRTRMTDQSKADQKFTGKDYDNSNDKVNKHNDDRNKAIVKMNKTRDKALDDDNNPKVGKKKYKKLEKKFNKNVEKAQTAAKRRDGIDLVLTSSQRSSKEDKKKQAEINKKDKADRASAKASLDRAGLEGALKAKPKREKMKGPKMKGVIRKESAFTDFCDAATQPLYEKEGEVPKCPPGYKYDPEMKMCVPKTNKDSIGKDQKYGNKDMKPGNGANYNVWGNSGYSGAGFAWEEGPTDNDRAGGQE